jgi:HAD superfamily hydrolase (TIGR01484 family)
MSLPVKLISTDFDGTLFAEFENPPVPMELQETIAELKAQGAKWVINTGRDMSSLMETLGRSGMDICPDFLVLVEREIYYHQESLYTPLESWNTRCAQTHAQMWVQVRQDLPRLVDWINTHAHAHIYEDPFSPLCIIAANNGEMDKINAYLADYADGVPHLSVVRNDVYSRFCHDAFTKGTALDEITRMLGLTPDVVLAAGDHLNDLTMLDRKYARHIVSPSNATPEVKAAVRAQGGHVSEFPHGHGVLDGLNRALGKNTRAERIPVAGRSRLD